MMKTFCLLLICFIIDISIAKSSKHFLIESNDEADIDESGVPAPVEGGVDYARKRKTTKDAKDTTKDKPVLQICPGLTHPDLPRLKCLKIGNQSKLCPYHLQRKAATVDGALLHCGYGYAYYKVPVLPGTRLTEGAVASTCERVHMRAVCPGPEDSPCGFTNTSKCSVIAKTQGNVHSSRASAAI